MAGKTRVIFLCTGNSARSQMAEAILRYHGGNHFEVHSAGFEPKGIHPLTKVVLAEAGYSIEGQTSKSLSEYLGRIHFGIIITVCQRAEASCPTMPGVSTRLHWPIEDPARVEGTDQEKINAFRAARDTLKERIFGFLKERQFL